MWLENKGEVAGAIVLLCVIIYFVLTAKKMIKISVYLRKLSQNGTTLGFWHSVLDVRTLLHPVIKLF